MLFQNHLFLNAICWWYFFIHMKGIKVSQDLSKTRLTVQSPNFSCQIMTQMHNYPAWVNKTTQYQKKEKAIGRFVQLQHTKRVVATYWRDYFLGIHKHKHETGISRAQKMSSTAKKNCKSFFITSLVLSLWEPVSVVFCSKIKLVRNKTIVDLRQTLWHKNVTSFYVFNCILKSSKLAATKRKQVMFLWQESRTLIITD